MSKWKPKPPSIEWRQVSKKHRTDACDGCGRIPRVWSACIVTPVNWMRGDDEVETLCVLCAIERGHSPPGPVLVEIFRLMPHKERQVAAGRIG